MIVPLLQILSFIINMFVKKTFNNVTQNYIEPTWFHLFVIYCVSCHLCIYFWYHDNYDDMYSQSIKSCQQSLETSVCLKLVIKLA